MTISKVTLFLITTAAAGCVYAQQSGVRTPFRTPQEAVRYYEDLVGRLAQQVRSMQDENAILAASNADLKQRVSRLENDLRSFSGELSAVRKQIAADAEVRKNQLNRLADKLAGPEKPEPKTPRSPEPAAPTEAEYVEHVVARGTTLNALAKAYGVSVKDIMQANQLKKPVIYAGQKLLIPVPKKNTR